MADQNFMDLASKTASGIAGTDYMMLVNNSEAYKALVNDVAEAILSKLTSKSFSGLETTAKNVIGALNELNSKTKPLKNCTIRDFTVTDGKITMTISLEGLSRSTGLYILSLNASDKYIVSVVFNYAYVSTVIAKVNANLYDNFHVNIKNNENKTGIVVEITADQIKSTQAYNYKCVKICPLYY